MPVKTDIKGGGEGLTREERAIAQIEACGKLQKG